MEHKVGVAFYDWGRGWLRDLMIITHPPYSAWHLSYVVIGAAMAPRLDWAIVGWTLMAFTLGMVICGHFLDELCGRPLRTRFSDQFLWVGAILSLVAAMTLGIALVVITGRLWVIPLVAFGGFIVIVYNLESFGGVFHRDSSFGYAWGSFPLITAYVAQTNSLTLPVIIMAVMAMLYSMAQRKLSHQVRFFRRKVTEVTGYYYLEGQQPIVPGKTEHAKDITRETLTKLPEMALKLMTWTIILAAVALALQHVSWTTLFSV